MKLSPFYKVIQTSMASLVIPSGSGQHGSLGHSADQTYYCFDCDRRLTIIATSDTGIIVCPICGHIVLEEFETPSSPPPPPPQLPTQPPTGSTASVDLESFFPTSTDIDSDVELFYPLAPPSPPPPLPFFFTTHVNTTSTGNQIIVPRVVDYPSELHIYPPPPPPWDLHCTFDSDVRHPLLPSSPTLPPPPPATDQRTPCPRFSDPSALIPLPPSESELAELRLPTENSAPISPPHGPSRSSDASDFFYSPSRDLEDEENPNHQPPSPPLLPPSISNSWDYFFPGIPELPPNSLPDHETSSDLEQNSLPNHEISSSDLLPPPPPPWLMSDLTVTKITEELLWDWKSRQCSICIDNFELNQMVRLTPCNHLYHSDCLFRWLDLHKSCPICRRKLSSR